MERALDYRVGAASLLALDDAASLLVSAVSRKEPFGWRAIGRI